MADYSRIQSNGIRPAGFDRPEGTAQVGEPGFAEALEKAIGSVEQLQQSADGEASRLASGEGNLHETAIALEQADIGMRVMTKARNKLIEAYQEVMRMSV